MIGGQVLSLGEGFGFLTSKRKRSRCTTASFKRGKKESSVTSSWHIPRIGGLMGKNGDCNQRKKSFVPK